MILGLLGFDIDTVVVFEPILICLIMTIFVFTWKIKRR